MIEINDYIPNESRIQYSTQISLTHSYPLSIDRNMLEEYHYRDFLNYSSKKLTDKLSKFVNRNDYLGIYTMDVIVLTPNELVNIIKNAQTQVRLVDIIQPQADVDGVSEKCSILLQNLNKNVTY